MSKHFVFLILTFGFFIGNETFSQCPLGVGISSLPLGVVCRDVPVTYTANPTNGAVNPQYIWVVNGDTIGTGISFSNSTPGDVIVYMSSDTCLLPAFNQVLHQIVYFEIDAEPIIEECNQTIADLQVNSITSIAGTPPYTYELLIEGQNLGQQTLYSDVPVGIYPFYTTEAGGCTDTTWITMSILECPPPIPSEVLTPNEDGYNDTWIIGGIKLYPENEVFIFDRWGQRVYHKKNYDNDDGWDAKYIGGNLPVSTYYYVLEVSNEKSDDIVLKGAISIFR